MSNLHEEIANFHQNKLYESELDSENQELSIIAEDNIYIDSIIDRDKVKNDPVYKNILNKLSNYKLKKHKKGEDAPVNNYENEILTRKMERMTRIFNKTVAFTIYFILKTGYLYFPKQYPFNIGNVFFIPKDKLQNLSPSNSRCLINCDNRLKVLTRFIRDYYLTPIFEHGKVDIEVHRYRKCILKYEVNGKIRYKLCFESVANIANTIHTTEDKYLLLDLKNAYNNVTFTFLYQILMEYLVITDLTEKKNVADGIIRLLSELKYYFPRLGKFIKRNKGVPQGCSFSVDMFVLCMDYIIKKIIGSVKKELNLEHKVDYQLITYVDDILILVKTKKCEQKVNELINTFEKEFEKYHFAMNQKKSKKSAGLPNCNLTEVTNQDKYLGLYFEKDVNKYLLIIENEIRKRWTHSPIFKDMKSIDQGLKDSKLSIKQEMSVRGKLQYRMKPFASSVEERNKLFHSLGYPNIADKLFTIPEKNDTPIN